MILLDHICISRSSPDLWLQKRVIFESPHTQHQQRLFHIELWIYTKWFLFFHYSASVYLKTHVLISQQQSSRVVLGKARRAEPMKGYFQAFADSANSSVFSVTFNSYCNTHWVQRDLTKCWQNKNKICKDENYFSKIWNSPNQDQATTPCLSQPFSCSVTQLGFKSSGV